MPRTNYGIASARDAKRMISMRRSTNRRSSDFQLFDNKDNETEYPFHFQVILRKKEKKRVSFAEEIHSIHEINRDNNHNIAPTWIAKEIVKAIEHINYFSSPKRSNINIELACHIISVMKLHKNIPDEDIAKLCIFPVSDEGMDFFKETSLPHFIFPANTKDPRMQKYLNPICNFIESIRNIISFFSIEIDDLNEGLVRGEFLGKMRAISRNITR